MIRDSFDVTTVPSGPATGTSLSEIATPSRYGACSANWSAFARMLDGDVLITSKRSPTCFFGMPPGVIAKADMAMMADRQQTTDLFMVSETSTNYAFTIAQ